ncbi:C4-dicarboxylate TRAP transporter substrate-binding protein [uncultured Hoeflea sp.]|uniref:C4-dicarboxylate TRAP transporter substrate-binding protein n=1 Tax=uncultured Hoeflea sp. TaxID=538666 RepID=UPI0030ED9DB8|tara:strand:+ start:12072 stop:13118 length:1047 start_codon:yes stop_codon:yes gene_type:complete
MKQIIAAATVALMAATSMAAAETTLILGEAGPNRGARAAALQSFADDVTARTNGEVKIDVQWGGALFKASAAAQSIANGVADLGTVIAVYFPQEMLGYGIADLPLRNADAWVGMRATDELMRNSDAIKASLADQNLVYLGTFTTSAVNIGCKDTAIRTVEDIDGLKVRGVGAYGKAFGDFGANLVSMSIYDAYQGLDSGLLDCSQGYSYAVAALKQQEVMTSYTLLDWGQVGALGIFMNKDAYDALDADTQAAMNEAGVAMADKLGELITADNEAAIQTMKDAGVEVIELDTAERDKLVEKGAKYVNDWVERANAAGLDGTALLEQYRALVTKYTEERDNQGYPWTRN